LSAKDDSRWRFPRRLFPGLSVTVDQPAHLESASQSEPSAFNLDESSCYHFRVLDPHVSCDPLRGRARGNNR
jgi:hypothetical protein